MRKLVLVLTGSLMLAGCVNSGYGNGGGYGSVTNSAAVRTVGGAAAGAMIANVTGGSKTEGALIGAVAGGGSCALTGNCH